MKPKPLIKTSLYGLGAGVCLAIGLYSLLGLLQAVTLYSGERLSANVQLWLPLSGLFLGCGSWLTIRSLRAALSRNWHE